MSETCDGETCDGSGRFSGRVDHYRFVEMQRGNHVSGLGTSATYGVDYHCHWEGGAIPCPACHPEMYGRVTKITKREG
jgi:hypothetical protein